MYPVHNIQTPNKKTPVEFCDCMPNFSYSNQADPMKFFLQVFCFEQSKLDIAKLISFHVKFDMKM